VLIGEQPPGPANAGLNLVKDKQRIGFITGPSNGFDIAGGRASDPAFALDGLNNYRTGRLIDAVF